MNALFVIHTPRDAQTAVYSRYQRLSRFMRDRGDDSTVLTPQDWPTRPHDRWLPLVYPFWVARWLARHPGEFDVAVFHSYTGWVVNLLRRRLAGLRHLRTVTAFHGLEPLYYAELKRQMATVGRPLKLPFRLVHGAIVPALIRTSTRRSDAVWCQNEREAQFLEQHRWVDAARITTVPQGVDADFFIDRSTRPDARRLLFVGQWQEMKGRRYLVEAFTALAREYSDLDLWCVGTLVDEGTVLAAFPTDLRARVSVRPRAERSALVDAYRAADVFLLPTLSEAFSRALLEAMATSLPVVATEASAPDFLLDGVNALVVPKRDAAAIVRGVRRLLRDPGARERLGRAARAAAETHEFGAVHAQVAEHLRRLVAVAPPVSSPRHVLERGWSVEPGTDGVKKRGE